MAFYDKFKAFKLYTGLAMHYCIVKGCNNKSNESGNIKFYSLLLKNKTLLHKWMKVIPLKHGKGVSVHSRICSGGEKQSRDDVPSIFSQAQLVAKERFVLN